MKQVKMFSCYCEIDLEIEMNMWIAENQGKAIMDIKYVAGVDANNDTYFSAMIIYEAD